MKFHRPFQTRWLAVVVVLAGIASASEPAPEARRSDAIVGVQAVALDQPRIYVNVRRSAPDGEVLQAKGADEEAVSAIEAFLDTGASGVVLSSETAHSLGVKTLRSADGKAVAFHDIGVGGSETFGVAEPLYFATAAYASNRSGENRDSYLPPVGPIRAQVKSQGGGLLELFSPGGLDVAGMPLMLGKVVVLDPKPLAKFDLLRTRIVPPGDREIPQTSIRIPLTYVSFAFATRTEPPEADGPYLSPNPMVGPDPFGRGDQNAQPVTLHHGDRTATGTFLLDTGAATSMISTKLAEQLGIRTPRDKKFELAVGGMGGGKQAPGVIVDRLELPTADGSPIAYDKAPLLVLDITVADHDGNQYTIDGVLGMNLFVASAQVTGGLLPDIGNIVDGPYRWIVINHAEGWLGLSPR